MSEADRIRWRIETLEAIQKSEDKLDFVAKVRDAIKEKS